MAAGSQPAERAHSWSLPGDGRARQDLERRPAPRRTPFEVGQRSPSWNACSRPTRRGADLLGAHHIPAIARSLPIAHGTAIPDDWPDDRYDLIWAFIRVPGETKVRYAFSQVPQRLLAGDTDKVIPG